VSGRLEGKVVALIGEGSDLDRALAIACAEAGANLALATTNRSPAQEFAMNSIANEAWAIGREQFVTLVDASDASAVIAFAEETWDRYGRCDALIAAHHLPATAPLDELSPDEWDAALATNLTAPFLAAHAFGILMDRSGGGTLIFVSPVVTGADASYLAARAGLAMAARALDEAWSARGVRTHLLAPAEHETAAAVAAAVEILA
jgi:NAD(P)-dependent dehydrogenase (short-subunit alcohol dehydrogenase family)